MYKGQYVFNKKEIGLLMLVGVVQLGLTAYLVRKNYINGFEDAMDLLGK